MGFNDLGTPAKVGIIAGVCCVGLVIVLLIAGVLSPDANTSTNINSNSSSGDAVKGTQVNIIAEGSWSGSIDADGTGSSYDGSGNETINVTGDPMIVSAVIQKKGGNKKVLKVQILKDGKVEKESSTTAAYGVVNVAS